MASIAGTTVFAIEGQLPMVGVETQSEGRPGVDQEDEYVIGVRGDTATIRVLHDLADVATASLFHAYMSSLQGSVVIISDNHGRYWYNMLVKKVKIAEDKKTGPAVGGINGGTIWVAYDVTVKNRSLSMS